MNCIRNYQKFFYLQKTFLEGVKLNIVFDSNRETELVGTTYIWVQNFQTVKKARIFNLNSFQFSADIS